MGKPHEKRVLPLISYLGLSDAGRSINLQPTALDAWKLFAYELHVALGALEEDDFLIVSIKNTSRFVQFAAQGSFGMRAEAVSNFYLPERESLDEPPHHALLELGWHPPTKLPPELQLRHDPDGSPEQFASAIQSEIARMGKVIKQAGIRGE